MGSDCTEFNGIFGIQARGQVANVKAFLTAVKGLFVEEFEWSGGDDLDPPDEDEDADVEITEGLVDVSYSTFCDDDHRERLRDLACIHNLTSLEVSVNYIVTDSYTEEETLFDVGSLRKAVA